MVCPLKELDTSALSASPRRLTEGVLEVEGPTSADDTEPVFRRLRNDFWDGTIFVVGMRRLGGIELQKGLRGSVLLTVGLSRRNGDRRAEGYLKQSGTLPGQGFTMVTVGT